MAHSYGLIKEGGYPVDRPHLKGMFDRKSGKLIAGPGSAGPNSRYYKIRFKFWTRDKYRKDLSDTWVFDPSFVELV